MSALECAAVALIFMGIASLAIAAICLFCRPRQTDDYLETLVIPAGSSRADDYCNRMFAQQLDEPPPLPPKRRA